MAKQKLRDSGKRRTFKGGAVRDVIEGKGRFVLISPFALKRLARIYELGAIKYSPRNWEKGMPISEFIDSAMRHINDYLLGDASEDHLSQSMWNLAAAMHMEQTKPELMDIPSRGGKETTFNVIESTKEE